MTEEVQPLTWQKRTNHEEHMQFFAKINEIVGQLSGTVSRSEEALADAEQALSDASGAVTTANAASAAASSAAQTVAGYNSRLAAAEALAAENKSNISRLDVETRDLYDRDANSVKLSSDHVQIVQGGLDLRGTNRTSNTTVGTDDTQTANGHRVISELDAYAPMVRTTGNQTIDGSKTFAKPIIARFGDWHSDHSVLNKWVLYAKFKTAGAGRYAIVKCVQSSNTGPCVGEYIVSAQFHNGIFAYRKATGGNDPLTGQTGWAVVQYEGEWYLATMRKSQYGGLIHRTEVYAYYGSVMTEDMFEWLDGSLRFNDTSAFTAVNNIGD